MQLPRHPMLLPAVVFVCLCVCVCFYVPSNFVHCEYMHFGDKILFSGIFVLGLPYALLHSGYSELLLIILAAIFCCYTSKILIACLYEENEDRQLVRVRGTYEDITNSCCRRLFPKFGGRVVNVTQITELVMTCILYLVISGNFLFHSFSALLMTEKTWSIIAFIGLLPCVFIQTLKVVSRLSLLCSLAPLVLGKAQPVEFESFLISVGVIIFSYTSQIFLPTLKESMQNPREFRSVLNWTHFLVFIFKIIFAMTALLTWGEETKEVIIDNFHSFLQTSVNLCLLAKALLSYPLPFFTVTKILHSHISPRDKVNYKSPWLAVPIKSALLLLTLLMAMFIPHFVLLMGLTGSVTGAAMTFLLPPFFHLKLKWEKLMHFEKCADILVFIFCTLAGLICSIKNLLKTLG
uniref:Vesicular inhibitory amino acid transporter n=1 Tax=Laticauda laticaudata TaxID=8630 RepID=A0A8C5S9G2_LATLA